MAGLSVNQMILDEVRSLSVKVDGRLKEHDIRLEKVEDEHKEIKGAVSGVKWFIGACIVIAAMFGFSIQLPWINNQQTIRQ